MNGVAVGRVWLVALSLAVVLAWPQAAQAGAAGLATGMAAVRVGSGEHQLRPLAGLWLRFDMGDMLFLEAEGAYTQRHEGGELASFRERWLRGGATLGCGLGKPRARAALALGPAFTWRQTLLSAERDWQVSTPIQPGLRYRVGLLLRPGERWAVDLLYGGSTRGRSHDQDLLLQGGLRW